MSGKRAAAFSTEDKPFAKNLCDLMMENKENQKFLAEKLGVKQQTISYYRNGQSLPDVENLIKIAKHYGVTTDYLLGLTTHRTPDIKLRAVCEYTGLEENTIVLLNQNAHLYDETNPARFLLANLVNELVCSSREIEEVREDVRSASLAASIHLEATPAPRRIMDVEMIWDAICANEKSTPGMIRVPARDAASWYLNRAMDKISVMTQRAIEQAIKIEVLKNRQIINKSSEKSDDSSEVVTETFKIWEIGTDKG